jgi:lipoprotein-anchoring transpeptidase ErfK/SrfK
VGRTERFHRLQAAARSTGRHPGTLRLLVTIGLLTSLAACQTVGRQAEEAAGVGRASAAGTSRPADSNTTQAVTSTTAAPPLDVTFSPPPGGTDVRPDAPISAAATGGRITSMSVTSAAGPLEGTYSDTTFTPARPLDFGATYTVTVTVAADRGDARETRLANFTTLPAPPTTGTVDIYPAEGDTVGIGMPIMISFSSAVPKEQRVTIVRWFTVTSTPTVEGAWRWISDTQMDWRPRYYWPGQTEVTVTADLAGRTIGDEWFTGSVVQHFRTGEAHKVTIDAATHQMVAYVNGEPVRSMPISTGRDAYPTASGTDLIMEKHDIFEMDSTSVGITGSDAYLVTVRSAQRLTNSGTFLHAAPWNGQLGSANISHGCVNASNEDASWMMDFTYIGDPVEIGNTAEQVQPYNGWGHWNIPFDEWANSA